ncbi:DJ-1 family glyoxalase III [uncultured Cetobacterium sp.]|uniref:DJ-1 family glyoxalase III n=1 Tax=uncultured Cetobacterium sp. TaxID=527638 RepID=UPI00261D8461|nr:DJ-1 family glyoxalase III [uncultured Cetobacterium sp.]
MNNKVFFMLANGFEIVEAVAPLDVLRRVGVEVITVSISDNIEVESAQKVKIIADTTIEKVNFGEGDAVILPGGSPGYINLRENQIVIDIVKEYLDSDKIVGAICGAPTVLGVNNLINDYKFTCHSSVIDEMNSNNYIDEDIVEDRNLITGVGAGRSLDFGFALAKRFVSDDKIYMVKRGMELV